MTAANLRTARPLPELILGLLAAALFFTGLAALHSAVGGDARFERQALRGAACLALMIALSLAPARAAAGAGLAFFAAVSLALVLVLFVGVKVNNARRWLDVGFQLQPSEFMKVALPLGLAFWYSRFKSPDWRCHLAALMMVGVPCALILAQPDLGTAVVVAATGVATVFFAGLGWRWFAGFSAVGAALAPLAWRFVLKDYQKRRILTMFNPEEDALGAGYHTIQSQIAVGSGGVWGKGFHQGTQAQLGFLPERHTDFIFAVFAEEFGLAGSLALLALGVLIVWRCLYLAGRTADTFGRLAAAGIAAGFFLTFSVNLGMVSGLLPVVGMPLPLVSYGGSTLLSTCIGFGLIAAVTRRKRR